jgi:hypothetical protein
MVQGRISVVVLALVCLIFFGFSGDGYAQQQPDTQQAPGKTQPPTVTQPARTWPRRQAVGLVVIADLGVSPMNYKGPCPAVFTFKGQIYANRATAVSYKFIRSDGVRSDTKTLTFEKEGRQEVIYTWEVGDTALSEGAVAIEVVYPMNRKDRSNAAVFKLQCTGAEKSAPENSATPTQDNK